MAKETQLFFVLSAFVSFAVTSDVYGLVGGSVQLITQSPVPEFDDFNWMFKGNNVLKYYHKFKDVKPYDGYKGRVEFNEENYSLTLKNLQKTDSGLYEAKVSGEINTVVAVYNLSVLDPAKAPELKTDPLSKDNCNFTVTCRSQGLSVNSSCYNQTCEETKEFTLQSHNLSLVFNGSLIRCNHSNTVSWNEAVLKMDQLTHQCKVNNIPKPNWLLVPVLVPVLVLVLVFIICGFISYFYRKRRRSTGATQCENTVYASVENKGAATPTLPMLEAPSTVYSTVGKSNEEFPSNEDYSQTTPNSENQDQGPPNTYESVPDKANTKPETIYASVSKSSKPVTEAQLNETT